MARWVVLVVMGISSDEFRDNFNCCTAMLFSYNNRMKKNKDISDQLREEIIKSGMSFHELSRASGVDTAPISRFVNEKFSLKLGTAARLASSLGLKLKKAR